MSSPNVFNPILSVVKDTQGKKNEMKIPRLKQISKLVFKVFFCFVSGFPEIEVNIVTNTIEITITMIGMINIICSI